ncbi:hypothetical protein LXL04_034331 [Taraxacum kok-saghyz]
MQSVKTLVDELQVLGKKMDSEDVTDAVLQGLDSTTYKTIIDAIHARDSPISFTELDEKAHKSRAHFAPTNPCNSKLTPTHYRLCCPETSLHQAMEHSTSAKLSASSPYTATPTGNPRPFLGKCQFCFMKGHSLSQCYAFKNKHPHINLPPIPKTTYHIAQSIVN